LDKLFTHVPLSPDAIILVLVQARKVTVGLAMHHRQQWYFHLRAHSQCREGRLALSTPSMLQPV